MTGKTEAREAAVADAIEAYNAFVDVWAESAEPQVLAPWGAPQMNPDIAWPIELLDARGRNSICFRTRDGRAFDVRYRGGWKPFVDGVRQRLDRDHVRLVHVL